MKGRTHHQSLGTRGGSDNPATPAVSFDPVSLMKLKSLELRAKLVVEGLLSGLHRSPYHGFSVEFTDYRPYSPGDDLRFLDWRLLARTDRRYLKRFEDETNLRCYVVLDLSRSMGFGSRSYSKADYAKTFAATLIYFLTMQRDAVGLITCDQQVGQMVSPRYRPGQLRRLLVALEQAVGGEGTNLAGPLEQIARTFRKRGMVVVISDFLTPLAELTRQLAYLRSMQHELILVRVLDPAELSLELSNPTMLVDAETGRDLYVDPELARAGYLRKFQAHAAALEGHCRDDGIEFLALDTDLPLERALFDFVSSRMQRGRKGDSRRRTRGGPGRNVAAGAAAGEAKFPKTTEVRG